MKFLTDKSIRELSQMASWWRRNRTRLERSKFTPPRSRSATADGETTGGGGCGCCGACGDAPTLWVDNFQTYEDGEELDIYGYGTPGAAPTAEVYSGTTVGIQLAPIRFLGDRRQAGRPFGVDWEKFSAFSFEITCPNVSQLNNVQMYMKTSNEISNLGFIGGFNFGSGGSIQLDDGSTYLQPLTNGDRFKINAEITSVSGTDELKTLSFDVTYTINDSIIGTSSRTLTRSPAAWCGLSNYGLVGNGAGQDWVTDKWQFRTETL
jgi:hypothetical protein